MHGLAGRQVTFGYDGVCELGPLHGERQWNIYRVIHPHVLTADGMGLRRVRGHYRFDNGVWRWHAPNGYVAKRKSKRTT